MNFEEIEIGLYKRNNLVSKIIRFLTRGQYSHSAIKINNFVFEAKEFNRVCESTDWIIKKGDSIDIYAIEIPSSEKLKLANFLGQQIGKKYDYMMVLGFLFFVTSEKRRSRGKWFCSELIFAALKKINVIILNNVEAWKVHPSELSYSPLLKYKYTIYG